MARKNPQYISHTERYLKCERKKKSNGKNYSKVHSNVNQIRKTTENRKM